tara:strand:- start:8623 stop:8850 length:228 start_codon:yes stop_codon:yes gene_type:complete
MPAPCPSPASEVTEGENPPFNQPSMGSQIVYGACRRVRRKTPLGRETAVEVLDAGKKIILGKGFLIGAMFRDGLG